MFLYSYRILCKELQSFVEPVVLAFHVLRKFELFFILNYSVFPSYYT